MNNIFVVFRSRNDTVSFYNKLIKSNVKCKTINTPKDLKQPCGICVNFDDVDYVKARNVFFSGSYPSFQGFYKRINANKDYLKLI